MDKEFESIQRQFAQMIRNPEQSSQAGAQTSLSSIEARRLNIYRDLFFNNIEGFVSGAFPVLKSLIADDEWQTMVRIFFQEHQAQTPYFLEISEEFLAFLSHHGALLQHSGVQLPEYALELAHWEWMELWADRAECEDARAVVEDVDLDASVAMQQPAWGVSYQYPVHKATQGIALAPSITCLLIYRDLEDLVGFIEVNALSLTLFEQLQNNTHESLGNILQNIAQEAGLESETVLSGGLDIARQWRDLGLLRRL